MKAIEEKARAYDKALERAKSKIKNDKNHVLYEDDIIEIFPQLAESEDEKLREQVVYAINQLHVCECTKTKLLAWLEKQGQVKESLISQHENKTYKESDDSLTSEDKRIREGLIQYFKHFTLSTFAELDPKKILAWLEKQGKEEYALKSFKDEDVRKFVQCIEKQAKAYEFNLPNRGYDIYAFAKDLLAWLEKQGEQKPIVEYNITGTGSKNAQGKLGEMIKNLKPVNEVLEQKPADVEPKFHEGDLVIVSTAEGDRVVQIASVEYLKDGHPSYFTTGGRWFGNGTKARLLSDKDVETITLPESKIIVSQNPAWSKEDEMIALSIEQVMNCASLLNIVPEKIDKIRTWLKSLKDRVQPHQKQDWSEEDEEYLDGIIRTLRNFVVNGGSGAKKYTEESIKWLKSLKGRYTWKPSEEQIYWLKWAIDRMPDTEKANEAEAVLEDLLEQLKKLK